jgi:sporulation protein YlmC with PRC-barrel domain
MNTVRYHQLVGKTVVTVDGATVGRVADLMADRSGDALVVTALLVGPTAFLRRVGLGRWRPFASGPSRLVPWQAVERIDGRIHLRVTRPVLDAIQSARPDASTVGGR